MSRFWNHTVIDASRRNLRGDGLTDNTAAWRHLMDGLPETGATVIFPPGAFRGRFGIGRSNV